MASKRITDHFGVLEYLKQLNSKEQKQFIKGASPSLLACISEICLNLLKGSIKVSKKDIESLRKYRKQIIALSEKKHSAKKRRSFCMSGGFLGSLMSIALPSIISAIVTASTRK